MSTTSEIIKRKRYEKGWTQTELAKKVGYADKSAIARIEAGCFDLPQSKIEKFAEAFGCESYELMGDFSKMINRLSLYATKIGNSDKMKSYLEKTFQYSNVDIRITDICEIIDVLNDSGLDKLLEYAQDLAEMDKYRKE